MPTFADPNLEIEELLERDPHRGECLYTLRTFVPSGAPARVVQDSIRFDSCPEGFKIKGILGRVIGPCLKTLDGRELPFRGHTAFPAAGLPYPVAPVNPFGSSNADRGVEMRLIETSSRRELLAQSTNNPQGNEIPFEIWHAANNLLGPGYGNGFYLGFQEFAYYAPEREVWQFQFRNRDDALFPSLVGALPEGASISGMSLTGWDGLPLRLTITQGLGISASLTTPAGAVLASGSLAREDQPGTLELTAEAGSSVSGELQVDGFESGDPDATFEVLQSGHLVILHVLGVRLG